MRKKSRNSIISWNEKKGKLNGRWTIVEIFFKNWEKSGKSQEKFVKQWTDHKKIFAQTWRN